MSTWAPAIVTNMVTEVKTGVMRIRTPLPIRTEENSYPATNSYRQEFLPIKDLILKFFDKISYFGRATVTNFLYRQEFSSVQIVGRCEFSSLQFLLPLPIFGTTVRARVLVKGKVVKIEVTRIRTTTRKHA
jgi:hypothetical protein